MEIASLAKRRYTTKAFDASRRIPQAAIDTLLEQLRHSPSSVNSQPWHFIVATTDEGKARIAKGTEGGFAYNAAKVLKASHVIVLCSRTDMTEEHLQMLLAQENSDGRFHTEEAKIGQDNSRRGYVALHRFDQKDLQHWMEKQTYLALGTLLLGAASLGLDATPMEGFDFRKLDEELGLRANGYSSLVLVALGYRDDSDFNAKLPKSRLPSERIYTYL
ncbi:TPA: oxygen-insensitive NAD(P)H-dependent nitroreductase NfsB [Pseudomonas aeruginosa]|uniref:oxygen-insensitive NAD(P)H-dependent nitroreductase NfsB n=1 Tax=Pseudomonas aeruginosa TaxID=287 RepID=UPI0005B8011F|nr:oxygen-insensitive NAD(P)H-dependent nitroreductase NfsB [Pseudomonas aeruginosa]ELM7153946.1 oxygen-insensitive NAD(P)H-dependent nitroreductase NfsB [Pseudomonas aeruginosa]MBI7363575.1 oxygen-insensitive NAD(P)H-dependent nitroreductase NfsB [Pseudomonas aeruginosa]NPS70999.1 oxygen-insensitive NAD(P)H-dependent nitroreductase NfsB [Pseudomonas aeruginosa]PQM13696.1 oxygen-insensitive NAD(P)H-dependent nitroreductase NfsB [Pseudomonas aeruginosa]TEE59226.1 oxygen-insensitive NAD(P)H-depe